MTGQPITAQLQQGLRQLGEDPAQHPCERYLSYIDLLLVWNRSYNLTGIREPGKMLTHHLLDSLSLLPYINGNRCLDVGTGAGLPGFILALARPEQHWVLLDSNAKKIRFLNQLLLELKPDNVELAHTRLADYRPAEFFSTVCARAFTSLFQFHQQTRHLLIPGGILLAMKGKHHRKETDELEVAHVHYKIHQLNVPGLDARRHVIVIS